MLALTNDFQRQAQSNHWKAPVFGSFNEQIAGNLRLTVQQAEIKFSNSPHVLTINGIGLKDTQDLHSSLHVYTFNTRKEKIDFYRECLEVKKNDSFSKIGVCGLLELACRSIYCRDRDLVKKLFSLHQNLSRFENDNLELRTPNHTYLSHVVVVPKSCITVSDLAEMTYEMGNKISQELFGTSGLFSITYNSPSVRSIPEMQHIHLDFFRTREERRTQLKLALQRY